MLEEENGFVEKRKDGSKYLSMGSRQLQFRVILQGKYGLVGAGGLVISISFTI